MYGQSACLTGQMRALLLSMLSYNIHAIFDVQPGEKDEIEALVASTQRALMVNPEIGTFRARASNIDAPDGWIACNGQLENQSDYPDLMTIYPAILKTATQFYAPDLRGGRHLLHADPQGGFPYLSVGGSNWITLTLQNMPPHTHAYDRAFITSSAGGEIPGIADVVVNFPDTTSEAGDGEEVDIRNPYAVVYYYLVGR